MIRECLYPNGNFPKGRCPHVDDCEISDLPCYGSMCDDCVNTCKAPSSWTMGVCDKYVEKKVTPHDEMA